MLSFVNLAFCLILSSPINGVICVVCFLMATAMRHEEKLKSKKEIEDE